MQNQSDFLILKNAAYLCIFVITGKSGRGYTNLTLELLLIFSVNILKYKYFGSTLNSGTWEEHCVMLSSYIFTMYHRGYIFHATSKTLETKRRTRWKRALLAKLFR
jgi:hypothetical protein